jgi:prophage tail gpP-like protein
MPFILKINMRSTKTGSAIRFIRRINNFVLNQRFNSLASTFSFDFLFDPTKQEHAEMICVTHMHEAMVYFTLNTDDNYQPKSEELVLTGLIYFTGLKHADEPEWVRISGKSKPGILEDSDWPTDLPSEIEGLSLANIAKKVATRFNLGIEVKDEAPAIAKDDDAVGKTSPDSQNVAAYLSNIARVRKVVLTHNEKGEIVIDNPNTKSKAILNFDFTDNNSDAKKIPGVEASLEFNGQSMHSHIIVRQDASDDEGSNGVDTKPLKNPLLPIGAVYRPKIYSLTSGSEFSADDYAKYELGREIRDGVKLTIQCPLIQKNGKLISPNSIVTVRDPSIFLYNISYWFVEGVDINASDEGETATLYCVLPFAYDFDESTLKNVFVDAHENLPRF